MLLWIANYVFDPILSIFGKGTPECSRFVVTSATVEFRSGPGASAAMARCRSGLRYGSRAASGRRRRDVHRQVGSSAPFASVSGRDVSLIDWCSGTPRASADAVRASFGEGLEPVELRARDLRREWQILRILLHHLLSFTADDELHELVHERVQRLAGLPIEIGVNAVEEGIAAVLHRLERVRNERTDLSLGNRQHLQGRLHGTAREVGRRRSDDPDAVTVRREILVQAALEASLLRDEVGVDLEALVPFVAGLQHAIRDLGRLVISQ